MGEYECAFGASSRVHVTYKSQVFPGAYVLEGSRLHVTGQGQIFDGTWDGKELTIDNNKAEYLGSYRESLQAGPAQSLEPGRWHLFMAAQVANGAVLEMCDAFLKHKVPIEWMTLLGQYDDPNESSQARRDMEPLRRTLREGGAMKGLADRHTVSRELERLTRTVGRNDSILLLFASHMSANGMDIGLSFEELDVYVAQLPEQALKVVLLEGCGSGGALDVLKHADILYASTPKTEGSAGGFLDLFTQALRPKFLFSASDVDGNGIVTLGEAFDVASDKSRLAAHYNRSPDGFVNIPQRATRTPGLDYTVSFVPFAVRVYSDPQSIQGN